MLFRCRIPDALQSVSQEDRDGLSAVQLQGHQALQVQGFHDFHEITWDPAAVGLLTRCFPRIVIVFTCVDLFWSPTLEDSCWHMTRTLEAQSRGPGPVPCIPLPQGVHHTFVSRVF